jgi:D-galactarolactone cycloisomerase
LRFENFILRGAVISSNRCRARCGITEIRKITALAANTKCRCRFTPGATALLAASVHLSAALQDCIVMELDYTYNPLREDLLRDPFRVENGYLTPPDKPGLGIELNQEALQKFAFTGAEDLAIRQKTLR